MPPIQAVFAQRPQREKTTTSPCFSLFLILTSWLTLNRTVHPPCDSATHSFMAAQDTERPLPKFGEWDVNNPASAEGFTVIFSKARDQKMNNAPATAPSSSIRQQNSSNVDAEKKGLFCCF